MLNQVILVGRLAHNPELQFTETGKKRSIVTLAVPRNFKNTNGEYDTDFLDCVLWTGIAENTAEYCKTGDIIGVKGRLQTRMIDNADGTKHKKVEMIAEKDVKSIFLSPYTYLKDKSMELVELAKEKGTPVLEDAVEQIRLKAIDVTEAALAKLEK